MAEFTPSPALLEIREEIDALDNRLANLLCQRLELVNRATPLKPTYECIRQEDRIEEIIAKVRPIAENYELDPNYLENIFRQLLDISCDYATALWQRMHPNE